jgi:hypothetical protein
LFLKVFSAQCLRREGGVMGDSSETTKSQAASQARTVQPQLTQGGVSHSNKGTARFAERQRRTEHRLRLHRATLEALGPVVVGAPGSLTRVDSPAPIPTEPKTQRGGGKRGLIYRPTLHRKTTRGLVVTTITTAGRITHSGLLRKLQRKATADWLRPIIKSMIASGKITVQSEKTGGRPTIWYSIPGE